MRIRIIIFMGAIISALAVGGVSIGLLGVSRNYQDALARDQFAQEISTAVFQFSSLTTEYLLHHHNTARVEQQLLNKHRSLKKLLAQSSFADTADHARVAKLKKFQDKAYALFVRAVKSNNSELINGDHSLRLHVQETRLLSQVQTLAQAMASQATILSVRSRQDLGTATTNAEWLIGSLMAFLAALGGIFLAVIIWRIIVPIQKLQGGISRFGAGETGFRFSWKRDDEIGNVGLAFDKMADSLNESERRTQREHTWLMDAINSIKEGFALYDAEDKLVAYNDSYLTAIDDIREIIKPGTTFEEYLRVRNERNKQKFGQIMDEENIQKRLEQHRNPTAPLERSLPNGRTIQIYEYKTQEGGTALLRVDVTKAKAIEQELRESQQQLSIAIESMNEAFAYFDADEKLVVFNKKFRSTRPGHEEIIKPGILFEEFIRIPATRAQPLDNQARDEAWVQNRLEQFRESDAQLYRTLNDGRTIQINQIKTNDGGTVLFQTDISNLVEARVQAESSNRAKSTFLAAASHDVRQPLQALELFLSVLGEKLSATSVSKDKSIQTLIDRINDSVSALDGLFASLLDISKLESQTLRPEMTEFDVGALIVQLAGQYETQAQAKGLKFKIDPGQFKVRCDEALLSQILSNFLSNSIRYTESGEISFSAHQTGDQVRIEVTDSGIGIANDKINKIYDEFYQIGNEQRDRTKGLGLGLSIAKKTADLLGLPLTVESTEGQGSTFAVNILIIESQIDDTQLLTSAATNLPDDVKTKTIVFIEDDPIVFESLKLRLETWDYNTIAAPSLEEVQNLLKEDSTQQPDLIISDLRLEGSVDGVQVIEKLRDDLEARVPGIILTGDTSPDRLKYIENAGLSVLHKPIQSDQLAAIIHSSLGSTHHPCAAA
ncbi:MAG: response regulator [Rhodospirillaceae bacterium]|jgi:two-component system, sensor histidine kinase|nr:response regulator [Rhodospirillales bacterium]MBT3905840.1 response regulator [Rhodospirillaceae bacterium]MBT4700126.1 response regulator [Rhodospirillaceae bacterium]MBT5035130.1 response regulator [Rhodospirillaceae bacterium]MBT6221149.1 response regulator [Rhodospirillaceae bacterium]